MLEKETKYLDFIQYNSPFEDIHLLVKEKRNSQNMLFDLGEISKIPNRELLKIRHIFITHYHMDHFIGLAHFIRVFLTNTSQITVCLYGPPELIQKVSHTISSFSWNLLGNESFKISLIEITSKTLNILPPTVFHKVPDNLKAVQQKPIQDYIYETENLFIEYLFLEHKIPVLGYKIVQKPEIHFLAKQCPYPAGVWIKKAKKLLSSPHRLDDIFEILPSHQITLKKLTSFFKITPIKSFVYLTDFLYKKKREIIQFARYADILYIENHFLEEDSHLAKATYHLSSKDVRDIIKHTQPHEFVLCHFSRRYMGKYQYRDFLNLLID